MRAGVDIDLSKRKLVDVQNIYHKLERRTLIAAYKYYCGKDLENAHSALADTQATYEVLQAQLDKYPNELQNDMQFLADYVEPHVMILPGGGAFSCTRSSRETEKS